jgi:CRP-like cAMP-binding protein
MADTLTPNPHDADDDPAGQATWEIATAESLRAGGDLSAAAAWYRKATNHLMEAGEDERAVEIAKLAAELVALEAAVRAPADRDGGLSAQMGSAQADLTPVATNEGASGASSPHGPAADPPPEAPPPEAPAPDRATAPQTPTVRPIVPAPAPRVPMPGAGAGQANRESRPADPATPRRLTPPPMPAAQVAGPRPERPAAPPTILKGIGKPMTLGMARAGTETELHDTAVLSLRDLESSIASMIAQSVSDLEDPSSSTAPLETHRAPLAPVPGRAAESESIAARLSALPLFSELPAERLRALSRQFVIERRAADERVCDAGAPEGPLFVVLHGSASVRVADRAGPIGVVSAGDLVGEIAALFGGPRTATVVAAEHLELVAVAPSLVRAMAREFPAFRAEILEAVRERLTQSLPHLATCLRALDDRTRAAIMKVASLVELEEGQEILAEGAPATGLFIVAAGEVECFGGELGTQRAVRARVGDLLGLGASVTRAPSGVSARAARRALVAHVEPGAVGPLLHVFPSLRALRADVAVPGRGIVC